MSQPHTDLLALGFAHSCDAKSSGGHSTGDGSLSPFIDYRGHTCMDLSTVIETHVIRAHKSTESPRASLRPLRRPRQY